MSKKKMIVLISSDGESFEVDEATALQAQTIAHLVEDGVAGDGIPLANVSSEILAEVIEYCKKHAGGGDSSSSSESAAVENLKDWDSNFVSRIDRSVLFSIMRAANYLNIQSLIDLTCQAVADAISGKTVGEIRAYLNVESDFSPEEEAANRSENPWAYE